MTLADAIAAEIRAALAPPPRFGRYQREIRAGLESLYLAAFAATWPESPRDAAAAWAERYGARAARLTEARVAGMEKAVAVCLRSRGQIGLGTDAHAFATAEAMRALAVAAKGSDADEGYHAEHSKRVAAFVALLLALWAQLQRGELTTTAYLKAVGDAFDAAVAGAPAAAQETLTRLRQLALDRAKAVQDSVSLPDDHEDAPSEAQRVNWANVTAGALWAASLAIAAYEHHQAGRKLHWILDAETGHPGDDDDSTCDDCDDLDGTEYDSPDDVDFWPGEGGTQCQGNCRCAIR